MLERIIKVIADQMGVDADTITLETNLIEDLKADSIDAAEMILELEDQMDVLVDDDAIMDVKTVQDIMNLLEK